MPRCSQCSKKVQFAFGCRCDQNFCAAHRMPDQHACTFDHKKLGRARLEQTLVKCVAPKIEQIVSVRETKDTTDSQDSKNPTRSPNRTLNIFDFTKFL